MHQRVLFRILCLNNYYSERNFFKSYFATLGVRRFCDSALPHRRKLSLNFDLRPVVILRPLHLKWVKSKSKCIYYVHGTVYLWRFSKSLCTTLLTLTWLVYLPEWSKCQGTLESNVANLYLELKQDHQTEEVSNGSFFHLLLSLSLPQPSYEKSTSYTFFRTTYSIQQIFFFFTFSSKSLVSKLVVHQLFVLILTKWPYLQHVISWIVD